MNILLDESTVREYINEYINFIKDCLLRFQIYCTLSLGESREDYESRLEILELGYQKLISEIPSFSNRYLRILIRKLTEVITTDETPNQIANKCEVLLREFLYVNEDLFRRDYFDSRAERAARNSYSDHLFLKIRNLIEDTNYDSAIVEAFKCLESHLKTLVKSASQKHSQELIREAFSGNEGTLKMDAAKGEQNGLKDFAAGAFALFRNPSAHRHVFSPDLETLVDMITSKKGTLTFYDELTAQTAIAVVALLLKMSTILALQNKLIDEVDRAKYPFGHSQTTSTENP
jgi:uncharacterized protein (TIGR02391 family)